MSALSVGLLVLIASTSTVSDSRPPLSEEELELLQSIEAEQNEVEKLAEPTDQEKVGTQKRQIGRSWRTWAATLTENLGASDAPVRWTRDEPGHLKPMAKGMASHRVLTELDGLPIRTIYDGVNELGAALIFDPQTVSPRGLGETGFQIGRRRLRQRGVVGAQTEGWLTIGSYLRDYGAGLSLAHESNNYSIFGQAAVSQPATGYLTAEQDTTRFNGHLRASNKNEKSNPLSWTLGIDVDEVQDLVRWELNSSGDAIELRRSRMGGFGRWSFQNQMLQVDFQPFYFRYVTEQGNPRRTSGEENVHQAGVLLNAAAKILEKAKVGVKIEGHRQVGEHGFVGDLNSAEKDELRAGLTAYIGDTLDRETSHSFVEINFGRAFGEQSQEEQSNQIEYFYGSIAGAYRIFEPLQLFGGVHYLPQFPSVKDLIRGASAEVEHLIHSNVGVTAALGMVSLSTEVYFNNYNNLRTLSSFTQRVGNKDSQADVGSLFTFSWRLSEGFELNGSNGFERTNETNYHYRRIRLVYTHSKEGFLTEASVSQWSNTTLWTNLAFQAPFLNKHFVARLTLDNIQDYESFRPDSSIPEPELSVRLLLRTMW